MARRVSHIPQARSGGTNPLSGRSITEASAAAPRDRSEPRWETPSCMDAQFISNDGISQWLSMAACDASPGRAA
ncbi:hypothetical protein MBOU_37770 [Mycobacterium bourgelatii]|uniref:Uncharacterized protein n=1 Tax=Mycobacterium bourgelatii TaxID=1273442 RepID=A0A7I9YSX4_MYCBU|nr:hypothetical protein MBOU_37770 [Mycobacterium bourgelatii]